MWRDELCLGFSSGFDASLDMDRVMGRLGVISIGVLAVSWRFFGSPKSRTFAGLPGPLSTSAKRQGDDCLEVRGNEPSAFSDMSKPCSLRMRRFAGLRSFETPGDKGLFPGLEGTCRVLRSGGKNSSRGNSWRGSRCRMVWVFKVTSCLVTKRVMSRVWHYSC